MSFITLLIIAIGLSVDSFAVSLTVGACGTQIKREHAYKVAGFMAFFQSLMPLIGWAIGSSFKYVVAEYDHWIAFVLLAIIGAKMIYEGATYSEHKEQCFCPSKTLVVIGMAIATSIDALAVGIGFGVLSIPIIPAIVIIGIVTFLFSLTGVYFGKKIGAVLQGRVEIIGGIVLVGIGVRILFMHVYAVS